MGRQKVTEMIRSWRQKWQTIVINSLRAGRLLVRRGRRAESLEVCPLPTNLMLCDALFWGGLGVGCPNTCTGVAVPPAALLSSQPTAFSLRTFSHTQPQIPSRFTHLVAFLPPINKTPHAKKASEVGFLGLVRYLTTYLGMQV
jgi:hypothetical protein